MVNRTPLRLVAIEETPPAEDELRFSTEEDESAAPVAVMSEQDMITRKVPEAEMIASQDTFRDKPKHPTRSKLLILAAAAAVVVVGGVMAFAMRGKGNTETAPASGIASPALLPIEPPPSQPAVIPAAPAAAPSPRPKANPETIFLGITAEPMEAELSVDGNVLAGHRLNLEVPKDPGIHVVSAAAPGYVPFNQQVSFSSDVFLKISLRRAHTPIVHQVTRTRPPQVAPSPKGNLRPAAVSPAPGPGPGLAPGMNLDGPAIRHNAKPIDERNPYKP